MAVVDPPIMNGFSSYNQYQIEQIPNTFSIFATPSLLPELFLKKIPFIINKNIQRRANNLISVIISKRIITGLRGLVTRVKGNWAVPSASYLAEGYYDSISKQISDGELSNFFASTNDTIPTFSILNFSPFRCRLHL